MATASVLVSLFFFRMFFYCFVHSVFLVCLFVCCLCPCGNTCFAVSFPLVDAFIRQPTSAITV